MPFSLIETSNTCLCLTVNQWKHLLKAINIQDDDIDALASYRLLEQQLKENIEEGNLVRIRGI